jgi:hypothetical protein
VRRGVGAGGQEALLPFFIRGIGVHVVEEVLYGRRVVVRVLGEVVGKGSAAGHHFAEPERLGGVGSDNFGEHLLWLPAVGGVWRDVGEQLVFCVFDSDNRIWGTWYLPLYIQQIVLRVDFPKKGVLRSALLASHSSWHLFPGKHFAWVRMLAGRAWGPMCQTGPMGSTPSFEAPTLHNSLKAFAFPMKIKTVK